MATQLGLYSAALLELGQTKLASLVEDNENRRILDEVYDRVVALCFELGQWKPVLRTVQVDSDPGADPVFGYAFGFTKPVDWVRTTALSTSPLLQPPLLDYTDEHGIWYASVDPIYVTYVSSDASYGGDLSLWPETFTRYVELKLAERICPRITQSKDNLVRIQEDLKRAKADAMSFDAMMGPEKLFPVGSWVRSRYSSTFSSKTPNIA